MATRTYGAQEIEKLRQWLDTNQDSASEKMVGELEEVIAVDYPSKRVVATNSCMGALHIALQTIDVGPGDEVIVDPIVVFAGMAVMYNNAVPVFADVDQDTFNMNPRSLVQRITPRTKAIICTHHFGNICEMEKILEIARENNLPIIEDCAHTLFAKRNDRYAGLWGDFSAFSFNHRKQLSTGQGGFLLVNSEEYAEKSKDKSFGRIPSRLTWNYAMPGIVAALALAQWEQSKQYVQKDHDLAELYSEAVAGCDWLIPQVIPQGNWCANHIWAAIYKGDEVGIDYSFFMKSLRENGGDFFLPAFMPYGAFGLQPSPVYRYPIFNEPRAYARQCPIKCPHYEGQVNYSEGACPSAEYLVPRLFNTVISPIRNEKVEQYAKALHRTVQQFL